MKGKIALVTGSTRGIGKAIAYELQKEGYTVIRHGTKTQEGTAGCDVSDFNQCKKMAEEIKQKYGKLDVLVNNSGITMDRTLKNMSLEEWNTVINVNLNSLFNVTRNVLELIPDGGRIITISSIVASSGNFGQTNYAATKAGAIGFTKSLAKELGKRKITVNAIAPGFIQSDMTEKIPMEMLATILELIPLKEMGKPEDVAHAVAFLCSEKARYITGAVVRVDGGLSF